MISYGLKLNIQFINFADTLEADLIGCVTFFPTRALTPLQNTFPWYGTLVLYKEYLDIPLEIHLSTCLITWSWLEGMNEKLGLGFQDGHHKKNSK